MLIGLPFRAILPLPDGAIEQGDRQHLAGLYSGILAAEPSETAPPGLFGEVLFIGADWEQGLWD